MWHTRFDGWTMSLLVWILYLTVLIVVAGFATLWTEWPENYAPWLRSSAPRHLISKRRGNSSISCWPICRMLIQQGTFMPDWITDASAWVLPVLLLCHKARRLSGRSPSDHSPIKSPSTSLNTRTFREASKRGRELWRQPPARPGRGLHRRRLPLRLRLHPNRNYPR